MMEMLTNLVTQSGVGATQLSAILLGVLFLIMIIGLAAGQELAFVLGGAGVVIGYLAWGGPGITIAMTKVYDQMQSYSMVAIPMFVLMANFLTHSKVADGLFLSIRYLLGPLKGGLGLAVIVVSTVFAATTGIVGASVVTMGMLSVPVLLKCGYKPSLASAWSVPAARSAFSFRRPSCSSRWAPTRTYLSARSSSPRSFRVLSCRCST